MSLPSIAQIFAARKPGKLPLVLNGFKTNMLRAVQRAAGSASGDPWRQNFTQTANSKTARELREYNRLCSEGNVINPQHPHPAPLPSPRTLQGPSKCNKNTKAIGNLCARYHQSIYLCTYTCMFTDMYIICTIGTICTCINMCKHTHTHTRAHTHTHSQLGHLLAYTCTYTLECQALRTCAAGLKNCRLEQQGSTHTHVRIACDGQRYQL